MGWWRLLGRGVQVALRNDATAFAYSLLATTTFGALHLQVSPPRLGDIFAFGAGAGVAFVVAEAIGSNLFRHDLPSEASHVMLLGSAFNVVSLLVALAAAVLVGAVVDGWLGWFLGAFVATGTYVAFTGANMALAHVAEKAVDDGR